MLRATGTVVVDATPQEVLEWILDLERYRQVDEKVGTVVEAPVLDADGRGQARYRGRLRGLPTPVDTQDVVLDRWEGLTLTGAPGVWTRWATEFEGSFRCVPVPSGTEVTHTETFWFKPAPVRWLAEAWLRRWFMAEMPTEVARLKEMVEADVRAAA